MTTLSRAAFARLSSPYLPFLTAVFVGVMVLSSITATKGVVFFQDWLHFEVGPLKVNGLITDGAFFLFPLSYVIGDVISEVYGFRAMRRTVASGFAVVLLASLVFWVAIKIPAAGFYEHQAAFESVLGTVPQIVAGSLAGYVVGEILNSYVLVKMKERAGERRLWARLIGSTVVGEFFDTLVFCSIAATAIGISTWSDFLSFVVVGFIWKTLVEIVIMPVTYAAISFLKRAEPSYREALDELESPQVNVP